MDNIEKLRQALNDHWKTKLAMTLSGEKYKTKTFLEHEIREIELCLTGEIPNIKMALDRIENIKKHFLLFL